MQVSEIIENMGENIGNGLSLVTSVISSETLEKMTDGTVNFLTNYAIPSIQSTIGMLQSMQSVGQGDFTQVEEQAVPILHRAPRISQAPSFAPSASSSLTTTPTPSVTASSSYTPSVTSSLTPTPSASPSHYLTPSPSSSPMGSTSDVGGWLDYLDPITLLLALLFLLLICCCIVVTLAAGCIAKKICSKGPQGLVVQEKDALMDEEEENCSINSIDGEKIPLLLKLNVSKEEEKEEEKEKEEKEDLETKNKKEADKILTEVKNSLAQLTEEEEDDSIAQTQILVALEEYLNNIKSKAILHGAGPFDNAWKSASQNLTYPLTDVNRLAKQYRELEALSKEVSALDLSNDVSKEKNKNYFMSRIAQQKGEILDVIRDIKQKLDRNELNTVAKRAAMNMSVDKVWDSGNNLIEVAQRFITQNSAVVKQGLFTYSEQFNQMPQLAVKGFQLSSVNKS